MRLAVTLLFSLLAFPAQSAQPLLSLNSISVTLRDAAAASPGGEPDRKQVRPTRDVSRVESEQSQEQQGPALEVNNGDVTQTRSGFTVDDLLRTEDIGRAVFTADGHGVIFERMPPYEESPNFGTGLFSRQQHAHLLYASLNSAEAPRELFEQSRAGGYWLGSMSPNGKWLSIYSLVDGRLSAGVVDMETRHVRFFDFQPASDQFQRAPIWIGSDELLYTSSPQRWTGSSAQGLAGLMRAVNALWAAARSGITPSTTVVRSASSGLQEASEFLPGDLLRVNVRTGATAKIGDGQFFNLRLSPSGRYLAALRNGGRLQPGEPVPGSVQVRRAGLVIFDLQSPTAPPSVPCANCNIYPDTLAWSADDRHLSYVAKMLGSENSQAKLIEYDARTTAEREYDTVGFAFACGTGKEAASLPVLISQNVVLAFGHTRSAVVDPIEEDMSACSISQQNRWFILRADQRPQAVQIPSDGASGTPIGLSREHAYVIRRGEILSIDSHGHSALVRRFNDSVIARWALPGATRYDFVAAGPSSRDGSPTTLVDRHGVIRVDLLSGKSSSFPIPGAEAQLLDLSNEGNTALFILRKSAGVFLIDVSSGGHQRTIEGVNQQFASIPSARQMSITYTGRNNENLSSCLMLPPGPVAGRRYPLIVYVYPGIRGECVQYDRSRVNPLNLEIFTSHGYAVLFAATPHASIEDEQRPTAHITDLILRATDAAIATGLIEPEALGVFGYSQGMREVLEVITETNRYKAAFAGFGMCDVVSGYGSWPIRSRLDESSWLAPNAFRYEWTRRGVRGNRLGARPWEDPARYIAHSPVFHADRIRTPLLIANSDLDGFSIEQGSEIFSALYRLNAEAEYVTYWGEPHGLESPANIRDFWSRLLGWYDRHFETGLQSPSSAPSPQ